MNKYVNETGYGRRQENKQAHRNHHDVKKRYTPASREEWAEVLASADRYY